MSEIVNSGAKISQKKGAAMTESTRDEATFGVFDANLDTPVFDNNGNIYKSLRAYLLEHKERNTNPRLGHKADPIYSSVRLGVAVDYPNIDLGEEVLSELHDKYDNRRIGHVFTGYPDTSWLDPVQKLLDEAIEKRNTKGTGWFQASNDRVAIPENWKELME